MSIGESTDTPNTTKIYRQGFSSLNMDCSKVRMRQNERNLVNPSSCLFHRNIDLPGSSDLDRLDLQLCYVLE